jgi:glycosyltransferase involved in cell wall biosynthesis
MRVGLNALYLVPGHVGGVETFGRELIDALVDSDPVTEYVVFTSLDGKESLAHLAGKCRIIVCQFHAKNRTVRYFWEQVVLPWQAIAYGLDVLHSLSYVGPVLSPVSTVLTIHDANSKVLAATMTRTRRSALWLVSRLAAKTADVVSTVSHFSKEQLHQWYGTQLSEIQVVLSGPGMKLTPPSQMGNIKLEGMVSDGPYIAAIGGGYPHKNIARLIEAYERIADQVQHRLIITGNVTGVSQSMLSDRVVCTGYLEQSDLQDLIRRCDLFIMPSLYEGFGFPVLEAQALGAPVACSGTASLPEIMQDSAAMFNPEDIDDMAGTMKRCLLDRKLNEELRLLARKNVSRFSWEQTAREYQSIYRHSGSKSPKWWQHGLSCLGRMLRSRVE